MNKSLYRTNKEIKMEKKNQLEEILQDNEKLKEIIRISPLPNFVIDKDHYVIYWNRALEKYTNIPAEEIVGTKMHWKAFYPSERPCMADFIVDERIEEIHKWYPGKKKRSKFVVSYKSRSAGDTCEAIDFFPTIGEEGKWLHFTAEAIRNSKDEVIGATETLEDITKQIYAQDENQKLKENEAFLREIHYKVKNNIEVISSLINLQSGFINDEQTLETSKKIHNFINSFVIIHEMLYQSKSISKIKLRDYIEKLTLDICKSYEKSSMIEVEINAENISLDMDTVLTYGLIINEIVTYSIKNSFPEGKGKITINFNSAIDRNTLTIYDDGLGFQENIDYENSGLPLLDSFINLLNQRKIKVELERIRNIFKFTFKDP